MAIGHLGKYERLDVLGSGASGVVYLAYDTLLRRQVALKEVRAAGPELDRVLTEARLLDRLRHPSLIAVHAVDEIDGVVVIDMELIRGSNLSEVMRARNRRPLPLSEALTIAMGILDGLAHAHDHRVLHRDIKPANILIGTDGRTVKLTDFGLAELLSSSSLAGGGGTYPYMAPEDFDETAGSDRRSDLWSVGVVVYEMVTGRRPFVVEKTRDPFAWKRVIDHTEPVHVNLLGLNIPPELDAVLTKALSKRKEDRYQDARSFRDALIAAAGVAPAAVLTETRPNADTRMRIPMPEPQLPTEMSPFFVFPDGNATADIDGFLAAAARNWDFSCTALADGRFANFLFKLHADEIGNLARSLAANNDLSPDRRLRMFLEYSQPDPDAPELDSVDDHETVIGVQLIRPDIDDIEVVEAVVADEHKSSGIASVELAIGISSAESRELAVAGAAMQNSSIVENSPTRDAGPVPQSSTATLAEPSRSIAATEPRTVATVSPVITNGTPTSTGFGSSTSKRSASPLGDDSAPREVPRSNPRYRTTAEPIRLRWWYWALLKVTVLPVLAGIVTHFVGTAVPVNVMMALLAVTGVLASLQMVITSGVRMPAWATFILVFPMAAGVMGGGALAAALVGPAASLQDLGKALSPGLIPLAVLAAAGVSIRRTWRFWVVAHILTALVSTADIVNAFILAK
ncbi:MAG: protein kinase domain-containing protein [Armatimonadota bacterium]